ncbi:tetratricopeptide repeat protein [candidate division KSB1 bacterium]|nr:tetratricopeptide repeat protein [candidate division KSB1 bacterium]
MGKILQNFTPFTLLALVFSVGSALGVDSQNAQAMRWFELGLKEKDLQKKIAAYAKAVELDPKFVEAYYNLGLAYRQTQDYGRAEKFLQGALDADPTNLNAETKLRVTYELAATYKRQGKTKAYAEALGRAQGLAQEPAMRSKINIELAQHYFEEERYEEVLVTLRGKGAVSGEDTKEADTLIRRADAAIELQKNYEAGLQAKTGGNLSEALAWFEKVREQNSGFKDVDKQIAEVKSALRTGSQKQTVTTLFEQAQQYERAGNLALALASYESLLKLEGSPLEARTKYENVKQQLAKKQLAETLEQEYTIAQSAMKARDWTRATLSFEKILALDASYKDARSRLSEAQKALDRESKDTIVARYYAEGVAAMNRRDFGGAMTAFAKVSKINPQYRNTVALQKEIAQSLSRKTTPQSASLPATVQLDSLYESAVSAADSAAWMQAVITFEKLALLSPNYRDVQTRLEHARQQLKPAAVQTSAATEQSASSWPSAGTLAALLLVPALGFVIISPLTRARYFLLRNDYAAAAEIYERILMRHPERTRLYPALANLYFLLGRRDPQALKIFKTILQLNLSFQNREGINAIVAEHYLTEGRTDSDAIEVLENALKTEQNRVRH